MAKRLSDVARWLTALACRPAGPACRDSRLGERRSDEVLLGGDRYGFDPAVDAETGEDVAHVVAEGANVRGSWPRMHGGSSAQLRPNVFVGDFGDSFCLCWMCYVNIWRLNNWRGCVHHLEDLFACCCCCALACLFGRVEVKTC